MASWNQGYTITVTLGLLRCGCATSVKLRIRKGALLLIVTQKNIVNVKPQQSQQRISSIIWFLRKGLVVFQQHHTSDTNIQSFVQTFIKYLIYTQHWRTFLYARTWVRGFILCVLYYMYFYIYLYLGAILPLKGCWQCLETFPAVTRGACGSPGTRRRGQMLPNTLQCTGHSPQQNNYLAPNVINIEVENPSIN